MTDLATLALPDGPVVVRRATRTDLAAVVGLLADDQLGRDRDDPSADLGPYLQAFDAIDADPAHLLLVGVDAGEVVATLQLSFLPGLAHRGALRAQIEAVRVRRDHRGRGLGAAVIGWAVGESRRRGAGLVQLTTHKSRHDAHRFYARLGFLATHEGFKLEL